MTPLVSLLTTPDFHACSCFMSRVGLDAIPMPRSPAWLILSNSLAAWITDFDGMQPTLRQTPPMYSRSTTQVLTLSCPRRMPAG